MKPRTVTLRHAGGGSKGVTFSRTRFPRQLETYPPLPPQRRFGDNEFDVRQPTFADLYKKQLLSPLCVFQLFSVLLWCLDEYWQYSLFTLFMILMFEGTVVFQRLKSLGALKGMGNKVRGVYVYRAESWAETTTDKLLPSDIVSLKKVKDEGGDVVPADLLLLNGSGVVSEAR